MIVLSAILTVLSVLVFLLWISRHVLIWRESHVELPLTPECPGPPSEAPFVAVVVAAKDEEDNIATCVRTMGRQDYPNFELVVANDRSEDRTAEIVERIAAEDPRVRLVNIEHLPDGWCGKNNAMQTAIATTTGEYVCMIDADCRQLADRTLSTAVQYAIDNRADLLSVLPVLEMKGFWENVVQPVCGGVMMIWFGRDKVNDPARPNAYANGAFMLIRRETYEAIGRHEKVKDQVNEDMHMAARIKDTGGKLVVVRSSGLYKVRMYTSLREILRGWSRIFFGCFGTFGRLSISMLVLVMMGLMPYATAAVGFAALGMASIPAAVAWACGLAGCAAVVMQLSVIFRYYRILEGRPGLFWTYPLGCLVTMFALIGSLAKLRRGASLVWKSTTYARQSATSSS